MLQKNRKFIKYDLNNFIERLSLNKRKSIFIERLSLNNRLIINLTNKFLVYRGGHVFILPSISTLFENSSELKS